MLVKAASENLLEWLSTHQVKWYLDRPKQQSASIIHEVRLLNTYDVLYYEVYS